MHSTSETNLIVVVKMFCEKCGGLLLPSGDKLVCSNCHAEFSEDLSFDQKSDKKKMTMSSGKVKDFETLPKTKAECPKCGNNEAFFWFVQTRASDEPPTKFFRCVKCRHTWREYL